jgi:threonylcarbamoyladenosine tRNA methylthiotransferase MtaB
MGRRHRYGDVVALTEKLRKARPEIVFGSDIIAGFPTETAEDFARTMALIDEAGLALLHVFPYSVRPNTAAAAMPQLAMEERRERARAARAKGEDNLRKLKLALLGTTAQVLVEEKNRGYTEQYIDTTLPSGYAEGNIVSATLTKEMLGL